MSTPMNAANLKRTVFDPYYAQMYSREAAKLGGAMTPAEELAFIERLRNRALGIDDDVAIVPTDGTELRLPSDSEVVAALRSGETEKFMSDGVTATTAKKSGGRAGMFAGIGMLAFLVLMIVLVVLGSRGEPSGELPVASDVITPTVAAVALPTDTIDPTQTPQPTATERPTQTPQPTQTVRPTMTATPDYLSGDSLILDAAEPPNEPVSIEIGGYFISVGTAKSGDLWSFPKTAEWWPGTHVRRVFAMPSSGDVLELIRPNTVINVRLRSGAMQSYVLAEIQSVHRLQTEVFAQPMPSVVIVFVKSGSDQRTIAIGHAVQTGE